MRTLIAFCIAATMTIEAHAVCNAVSPAHTLALTELYTSDGCDSCPPANRWMSALPARGFGADKVVPLSLHVDYWDYIGWKDIYAQPQFTDRQRMQSRLSGSTFVYTPQVVVQGRDFRGWGSSTFDAHVKAVNARPARADIRLGLEVASGKVNITASALAKVPGAKAQLFVALTQSRISSDVKAGENRGVTLKHDYVVREWLGPVAFDAAGGARLERAVVPPTGAPTNDLGVVALVQDAATGEILQALKLDTCGA